MVMVKPGGTGRPIEAISARLAAAKLALETQRSKGVPLQNRLETLGRKIERDRFYLDRSTQFAIDDFNAEVETYNILLRAHEADNEAERALVERYNAVLGAAKAQDAVVDQMIDNYNAKLRRYGH